MDPAGQPVSNREFIAQLRQAAERYIRAVDEWETAYRKYYRLADPMGKTPTDLVEQQGAYDQARKRLAAMVPRARGLTFRYGLRDPWTGLLRSSLGQFAPQDRDTSAISRAERAQVIECLILLAEANAEPSASDRPAEGQPETRGLLQRLKDFFY